ncbi:MAG: hypothetical protein Edafosvirus6_43 [Edafosvirus sp.]|uniref:Uncharacterized protein n=1 Tax=Edafosvirus sp. TaxID=2487765 RepID=A0A3G4ZV37_9VIRU|nr:MAG: hypothetical protein Edafosvirus6_43 [Edafosvirus sp.]
MTNCVLDNIQYILESLDSGFSFDTKGFQTDFINALNNDNITSITCNIYFKYYIDLFNALSNIYCEPDKTVNKSLRLVNCGKDLKMILYAEQIDHLNTFLKQNQMINSIDLSFIITECYEKLNDLFLNNKQITKVNIQIKQIPFISIFNNVILESLCITFMDKPNNDIILLLTNENIKSLELCIGINSKTKRSSSENDMLINAFTLTKSLKKLYFFCGDLPSSHEHLPSNCFFKSKNKSVNVLKINFKTRADISYLIDTTVTNFISCNNSLLDINADFYNLEILDGLSKNNSVLKLNLMQYCKCDELSDTYISLLEKLIINNESITSLSINENIHKSTYKLFANNNTINHLNFYYIPSFFNNKILLDAITTKNMLENITYTNNCQRLKKQKSEDLTYRPSVSIDNFVNTEVATRMKQKLEYNKHFKKQIINDHLLEIVGYGVKPLIDIVFSYYRSSN